MNIFIYRPDLRPNKNIDPNLIFTKEGKPYFEWKREQEIWMNYRLEKEKEKLNEKPDWKVYCY